ncbi:cyclase family protein [Natrialba asiatica]|uniref:Metal-dependent cyclase n=1 Tax=Natrialba asiatica (strain ATCC 700177 / DSM 12278 / JCM 9576 / FERM P-10747 / NBRC 102637 / 172P1) TaxID=29540 RepID=M0ALX0_NATA1|nr:cyclase family protein [Natrialba asiatica]ELY98912.1 metal-dependent cyclase [Natrialba asiatica DSM 12278]
MNGREPDHNGCAGDESGRRRFMQGCGAVAAVAAAGMDVSTVAANADGMAALLEGMPNNWGRWGADDELGALNLLDETQAARGLQAATCGGMSSVETFTLQVPMTGEVVFVDEDETPTTETGDPAFPGRTPARRGNVEDERSYREGTADAYPGGMKSSDDRALTDFFMHGTTHLDSLGHAWYGDQIYNGFDALETAAAKSFDRPLEGRIDGEVTEISETRGHARADISPAADAGISGRGVLLDVGRHQGGPGNRLPLGTGITLEDLLATADEQGVAIRERDILLVRTGAIPRVRDPNATWDPTNEPGLEFSEALVRWLHEFDIPMIGADNLAVEKVTQEIDGREFTIPLHGALLRNLGCYLNEILWLDELAESCAADGTYEFLFTGAPLHVERATAAPINPLVLKGCEGASGSG